VHVRRPDIFPDQAALLQELEPAAHARTVSGRGIGKFIVALRAVINLLRAGVLGLVNDRRSQKQAATGIAYAHGRSALVERQSGRRPCPMRKRAGGEMRRHRMRGIPRVRGSAPTKSVRSFSVTHSLLSTEVCAARAQWMLFLFQPPPNLLCDLLRIAALVDAQFHV